MARPSEEAPIEKVRARCFLHISGFGGLLPVLEARACGLDPTPVSHFAFALVLQVEYGLHRLKDVAASTTR